MTTSARITASLGCPFAGGKGLALASSAYADYLQLPALLSLQRPAGAPRVPDELLFIIVHQTHELWFKQTLQDLTLLVAHLQADDWSGAKLRLERVVRIVRLLVEHLDVLSTMPASEFQAFRAALGSASGMQSEQYRALVLLIEGEGGHLSALSSSPGSSLRLAFLQALGRSDLGRSDLGRSDLGRSDLGRSDLGRSDLGRSELGGREPPSRVMAVSSEAAHAHPLLAQLWHSDELTPERGVAELLLELDQVLAVWRGRHVSLARQMIGDAGGTGGSAGVRYLEHTAARRFFPELHAAAATGGSAANPPAAPRSALRSAQGPEHGAYGAGVRIA